MAKLKCWKKGRIRKLSEIDLELIGFQKKKTKDSIDIGESNVEPGKWFAMINFGTKGEKRFKSKPQALKFAKSYMKAHNKC